MRKTILFSLLVAHATAQDVAAKDSQPVLTPGSAASRPAFGELPSGCIKSYGGPSFKLAAIAVGQQIKGERLVSEGAVTESIEQESVLAVNEHPNLGTETILEYEADEEKRLERRRTRLSKVIRRQAPPPDSDVVVTSRTTKTSTATITVSPVSPHSTEASWTKTVYGATVVQAPNGQVQIVETPVPIVLQPKTATRPVPFAPQPASVPRIVEAANGQLQAAKAPKTPRKYVDARGAVVAGFESTKYSSEGEMLELSLSNGVLKDKLGRTGYISAARQFQFDKPVQYGALVNTGFGVCDDGFLALGSSRVFYQCKSGSMYNVYDQKIAGQCTPVNLLFFEEYKFS